MTTTEFIKTAKRAIVSQWNARKEREEAPITPDNVFVVWQCKTLQNWKAMLGTVTGFGYYEFTWDGDKDCGYLDTYKKVSNSVIRAD